MTPRARLPSVLHPGSHLNPPRPWPLLQSPRPSEAALVSISGHLPSPSCPAPGSPLHMISCTWGSQEGASCCHSVRGLLLCCACVGLAVGSASPGGRGSHPEMRTLSAALGPGWSVVCWRVCRVLGAGERARPSYLVLTRPSEATSLHAQPKGPLWAVLRSNKKSRALLSSLPMWTGHLLPLQCASV